MFEPVLDLRHGRNDGFPVSFWVDYRRSSQVNLSVYQGDARVKDALTSSALLQACYIVCYLGLFQHKRRSSSCDLCGQLCSTPNSTVSNSTVHNCQHLGISVTTGG